MKVLALTKYGDRAASTRQRFLQYAPALTQAGIELKVSPLLDNDYLDQILAGARPSALTIANSYIRRLRAISHARSADLIWLHCEFLPFWPSFAEVGAAKLVRKPIVFDFDDAIFHMYDDSSSALTRMILKDKLQRLLTRVTACTCGNAYLRDFAARFCPNSQVFPTVVDTDAYRPGGTAQNGPLTIGWIGSPSTWVGVRPILPVIEKAVARSHGRFLVVGAGHAAEDDLFPGMEVRKWREETEIADVQAMDIGIMPLLDRPFERGKSGYKLIQYMACGLPVVASPIGVNSQIVKDGANGFLAATEQEWGETLARLLGDSSLRKRLGAAGRDQAVAHFSLASQKGRLIDLFRSL